MIILCDESELLITIQARNTEMLKDVLNTITDIKKEYSGGTSERQKQKQLMQDMEQQIAEILSEDELE